MSKKAFNITVEPRKAIDLRELTYWLTSIADKKELDDANGNKEIQVVVEVLS